MKQFFILIILFTSISFAQNDISYPFSSSGLPSGLTWSSGIFNVNGKVTIGTPVVSGAMFTSTSDAFNTLPARFEVGSGGTAVLEMYRNNGWTTHTYGFQIIPGASEGLDKLTLGSRTDPTFANIISFDGNSHYVGIGTTSPAYGLHVVGSMYVSDQVWFPSLVGDPCGNNWRFQNGTSWAGLNYNFGVGTITPQHKLSLYHPEKTDAAFGLTSYSLNKNVSSIAQAEDTSALSFKLSFYGSPMLSMVDSAGNCRFGLDSLGKITALSMKDGTSIKLSPFVTFGTNGSTTTLTGTHFLVYGGYTSIGENAMPTGGFSISLSGNTIVKNKLSVLDTLRVGDYTTYSYIIPGDPQWTTASCPEIKTNIQLYSMLDTTDNGLLNKFLSIKPVKYNFKKELLRGKTTIDTTGYFLKGESVITEQNKMIVDDSTKAELYSKIDHIGFLASEMSVLTGNEKEISGSEKEAITWRVIQKLITQNRDQEKRIKAIEMKVGL